MQLALLGTGMKAHAQYSAVPSEVMTAPDTSLEGAWKSRLTSPAEGVSGESSSSNAYVRPSVVVAPKKAKETPQMRPLSKLAIGFKADTLGAGVEAATPLSRNFNLRGGVNLFSFGYFFDIDNVDYNSQMHLRSGQMNLDWFPKHGGFHISPGVLYFKSSLAAISSVQPGRYFELGDQGFLNSVDDPVNGNATVVFPRKFAPMLTIGFGNLIPRSGRHLSFPIEFGAAYTGAARINVTLDGTACIINQGCFSFASSPDAQKGLKQEISKLNEDLKRFSVYPIVSMGVAYRF